MKSKRSLSAIAAAVLLMAIPAAANADTPFIGFNDLTATNPTTELFEGAVNPGGETTTYKAEYDLEGSTWCNTHAGAAAHTTTPQVLGFMDSDYHPVSITLPGVTSGAVYCLRVSATNASDTNDAGLQSTPGAPRHRA